MKNLIFLVIIYIILNTVLIVLAKSNPESNMPQDINAILIKCPKNSVNTSCEPHLIINIHMNPTVDLNNMEDSWILDEVYDPTKRTVSKIISPYLIVVSRGEPVVMYPLQFEKSIKQEIKSKLPTGDDVKEHKGSPSSETKEPSPPINMKEGEDVKDVQGSPSSETNKAGPLINMKEGEDGKNVQGSTSHKTDEPHPSMTMKEREDDKNVQDSSPSKSNESPPSINMKEGEEMQESEDVKDVPESPSKTNEPSSSINMKEGEDVKEVQDPPSPKTKEPRPSTNIEEREEAKEVQGSPSPKTNEPSTLIIMKEGEDLKGFQGSPSPKTKETRPSTNIKENEDVKEVQGSPSPKTNEPSPSINMKGEDAKEIQGSASRMSNDSPPSINMAQRDDVKDVQGSPSGKTNEVNVSIIMKEHEVEHATEYNVKKVHEPPSSTNIKEHAEVEPLQGSLSGKTNERKDEQPIEGDIKEFQDSPSGKTIEPLTSINIVHAEVENLRDTQSSISNKEHAEVKDIQNDQSSTNIKEFAEDPPLQGAPSAESNEPQHSINTKEPPEVKSLQDTQYSITMKEPAEDSGLQGSPTGESNESHHSINIKEHSEVKDIQNTQSSINKKEPAEVKHLQDTQSSINMKEPAENLRLQGSPIGESNESHHSINIEEPAEVKELQGNTNERLINMKERVDGQPTEEDINELQGSPPGKIKEPLTSINMEHAEVENHQETQSSINIKKSAEVKNLQDDQSPINIKESAEGPPLQGAPSGESNEPQHSINIKEHDEVEDLQGSPSGKLNEPPINVKEHADDVDLQDTQPSINMKEHAEVEDLQDTQSSVNMNEPTEGYQLQGSPSGETNEHSINMEDRENGDTSRLKRNHGLIYSLQKALGSNFTFHPKTQVKDPTWSHQEPFGSQNEISSLGLIEVIDPSLKKNRMEGPKIKEIPKYNNYLDKQENVLMSNQYYNPDMKYWNRVGQLEKYMKESVHKPGNWDKQMLDMDSKNNFYQHPSEATDYQLKSGRHRDNKKEKDFPLFDRREFGDESKHNSGEMKNYKPSYKTPENIFSYKTGNKKNNLKTVTSNSNVYDLSLRSKNLPFSPYEKENYPSFESHNNRLPIENDFSHGRKGVRNNFKLPSNSIFDLNDVPRARENDRYDLKQPLNLPSDLNNRINEHFEAKTPTVPYDLNDKGNENNRYDFKQPLKVLSDLNDRTNKYGKAKTTDFKKPLKLNIDDLMQPLNVPPDLNDKRNEYSEDKPADFKKPLKAPSYLNDRTNENASEDFRHPLKVPFEFNDRRNENGMGKTADFMKPPNIPTDFNDRTNEFYNVKNKNSENSIYKEDYLPLRRDPEPLNVRSDLNIYQNSVQREKFNFNEPMESFSGMNDISYPQKYDQFKSNPYINDDPLRQSSIKSYNPNFIVSHRMKENLQNNYINKIDPKLDRKNPHLRAYHLNPEYPKSNFNPEYPKNNFIYKKDQHFDRKYPQSRPYNLNAEYPENNIYKNEQKLDRKNPYTQPFNLNREDPDVNYMYKNDQRFDKKNPYSRPYNLNPKYSENNNIYKNDQKLYIKNPHIPEEPEINYINNNDKQFDWKNSHNMPNKFNPEGPYPDLGESYSYSKFPPSSQKNPYSAYPMNKSYRSLPFQRYRNRKRIRRSNSLSSEENNLNSHKVNSLQNMEENDDASCDTCGGKNKKKDDKPPARYCSALTEQKGPETKLQDFAGQEKLNDVIPCDTCGGKNKKGGGKPLPGGLETEIHTIKAKSVQQLTPEDMIPCEKCKGNREGNLAPHSCGCVGNPSACNCEPSKLSRTANQSKEDISYVVFNMNTPIPFLTTKLRIFRRRHNTWFRVIPVVTLDSVSGIFATKNMSMIFSSRVGTFRQEKSSSFLNHKLVIPITSDNQVTKTRSSNMLKELQDNIGKSFLLNNSSKALATRAINNFEGNDIKRIESLGYFPASMKALQKCPHKDKHLCLNIRGEKVPAFSIKVKIPFRENAFMLRNKHVVKISRIVTDATTKDALQISIDVINKGLEPQEYSIYVFNCPLSNSALSTTSVKRYLLPNVGQTVTFLLPFISSSKKKKKFSCDVVVKDYNLKNSNSSSMKSSNSKVGVIAKRPMDIKVHSRCFCIWRCRCHCLEKLETFINYNLCERMTRKAEEEAGLIYNCPPGNEQDDVCITDIANESHKDTSCNIVCKIQSAILTILIWMLILGVLKAVFGLCIQSIGQWKFETVQPGRYYACTSRLRVFIVNIFFFIILPFACWCKCFQPKPEDLMAASTDWSCNQERDEGDCSLSENKESSEKSRLEGGQAQKLSENLLMAFAPHYENGLFKDDKQEDEESTAFILEVLEESKSSLSKMMSQCTQSAHSQEIVPKVTENSEEGKAAEELVDSLKNSQRAFRTMSSPVGGVIHIPENCQYCVKGFFLPTMNNTFEFFSYHPLVQYIGFSVGNQVKDLPEPQYLHTDDFSRTYANELEVLKAGDLSVVCPPNVPCINVSPLNNLENSFVKLSALLEESKIVDKGEEQEKP